MAKIKTIEVIRRSDGERTVINAADFNQSAHERISASPPDSEALAENDTNTSSASTPAADADNLPPAGALAETPAKSTEEIEAELNQLMDDQGWRAIATLAEEHNIERGANEGYRDLIPAISKKLYEAQTNE